MTSASKTAVVRLLREVWSQGDTSAVKDLIGERYTIFHDPGDPWEGKVLDQAAYVERVLSSRAPFPDQSFSIVEMLEDENKIAVSWTWLGTHRIAVAGIAATNRVIRTTGATIYSFAGPLLTGHWQIVDRLGVFQQLAPQTNS